MHRTKIREEQLLDEETPGHTLCGDDAAEDVIASVRRRCTITAVELNDDAGGPGDAATSMGLLLWGQRLLTGFRRDSESISPMTARGTINVVVWIVATVAIGLLGRLLVPALGAWWGAIALAVMVWVAIRFDRRREPPA